MLYILLGITRLSKLSSEPPLPFSIFYHVYKNRKEAAVPFVSLRGLVARTIASIPRTAKFRNRIVHNIHSSFIHGHCYDYVPLNYYRSMKLRTIQASTMVRSRALFYFYFLLLKLKGTQGKLHTQFIIVLLRYSYNRTHNRFKRIP